MLSILALLAFTQFTHAQIEQPPCRKMGFFFCDIKNPQWVIDENANRIGYYLAQKMYGNTGLVKVDYQSAQHLSVSAELKKIFKKYKIISTFKGLGPLGAEAISVPEIYLSANDAFSKLTAYGYYQSRNREDGKKDLSQIKTFLALFPDKMKSVSTSQEIQVYKWSADKHYRATTKTEIEASSWGKEPLEQELNTMGVSKIVIEEKYDLKAQTETPSGDTIETINISVEASYGQTQDMQYTRQAFVTKYAAFPIFAKLLPAKGGKIQGMVASGFQADDVIPIVDANKQTHWIFFLPSMEGPNYFDFNVQIDKNGLVASSGFNELCYENRNVDYFPAIQYFMDQGFIDSETMSSKNILVRNRNYGDPNLEKCEKLAYPDGVYRKLSIRSILH